MEEDKEKKSYRYLDNVDGPEVLKSMSNQELCCLSQEIRTFLIEAISKTGGHIASNLGVVELTIALHRVLNSPWDKIIWDVGHQTYVHKILTGRKDRFKSLRQLGGLSGFPKTEESIHDIFNTGHSSTSISAALGMARARDLKGEQHHVVAVIGDAALSGGMALEALNDAGMAGTDLMIILNDNGMSISRNVGSISRYLSRLRVRPVYYKTRESIKSMIDKKLPRWGKPVRRALHRFKSFFKRILIPSMFFEDLGFRYFGPIDGHNIREMLAVFEQASTMKGPVLVHVSTKKGKGYPHAEEKPEIFHGVAPFEIETGAVKTNGGENFSAVFGKKIVELAEKDTSIVTITAGMPDGTGLNTFKRSFPKRFFDVGIAEQHAVTLAAGMAMGGVKPVVAIYSTFLQRSYDQLLHDVALQNLHVIVMVDRAGIVGDDGETHQGIYDIAYLLSMPGFAVLAPASPNELRLMLDYAIHQHKGPIAIRYPRGTGKELEGCHIPVGHHKGYMIREGKDVTVIAAGVMLSQAISVCKLLEAAGIFADLINPRFLQPVDTGLILGSVKRTGHVVVIEDGITEGGFGSKIMKLVHDNDVPARVLALGFPNEPIEHGDRKLILRKYGLEAESIYENVMRFMAHQVEGYGEGAT